MSAVKRLKKFPGQLGPQQYTLSQETLQKKAQTNSMVFNQNGLQSRQAG